MRMRFELDDDEYAVGRELFARRCVAWAAGREEPVDADVVAKILDSRHTSSDGRLNHWTADAVRRAVLDWIPGTVLEDPPGADLVGGSLRAVIRYQAEYGLLDPRGESLARLDDAVRVAVEEYPAAVAEVKQQAGDPDLAALFDLLEELAPGGSRPRGQGRDELDLGELEFGEPDDLGEWDTGERTFAQLPIVAPPEAELAAQAERSVLVAQVRRLVEWVGPQGRSLTERGMLRLADAREAVAQLDTGDEIDGIRSSADLPRLALLTAWARKARLVRVVNGQLRQVAKARPLLSDPVALWHRLFESFSDLGAVLFPDGGPFGWLCQEVTADVLNTLYSLPYPMPVLRLQLPVWLSWRDRFFHFVDSRADAEFYRAGCDAALDTILETLAALGAVESSVGVPHPDFSADLADGLDLLFGDGGFDPSDVRALRRALRRAGPLVRLTDLGTAAVRRRMLAEGREAGVVGELAAADPGAMLGTVADHFHEEAARLEIRGWLDAHGGDFEPLLTAVAHCPFRVRASAMLSMLILALPERPDLLTELRDHPQLGPLAVTMLVERGALVHTELDAVESGRAMTESFLMLLEVGGPEEVQEQLAGLTAADRADLLEAVRAAEHPATAAVADLVAVLSDLPGPRRHLRSV